MRTEIAVSVKVRRLRDRVSARLRLSFQPKNVTIEQMGQCENAEGDIVCDLKQAKSKVIYLLI